MVIIVLLQVKQDREVVYQGKFEGAKPLQKHSFPLSLIRRGGLRGRGLYKI